MIETKFLDRLFKPKGVVILGSFEGPNKVGYELVRRVISGGYSGKIYPVNPKGGEVLGIKVYRDIGEVDGNVDLALIAIPAKYVPKAMESLGSKGVRAAVIFSSGFSEVGNVQLETEVRQIAKQVGIRVIGPNCAGIVFWGSNLYASFVPNVKRGELGLISQSGAFTAVLIDYMLMKNLGVYFLISYGNRLDVTEYEIIEYFYDDENLRGIMLYLEGLGKGEGKALVNVLRKVIKKKPVVVLKVGRGEAGFRAVKSHTGAMAGEYRVYSDILTGIGIPFVNEFYELVDVTEGLSYLPSTKGNNIVLITNSGGPGAILVDHLFMYGINLPKIPNRLRDKLSFLPEYVGRENPIDLTASGLEDEYYNVVREVIRDDWTDIIISLHVPPSFVNPVKIAKAVYDAYIDSKIEKPLIPLFLGPRRWEAYRIFNRDIRLPCPFNHRSTALIIKWLIIYSEVRGRLNG